MSASSRPKHGMTMAVALLLLAMSSVALVMVCQLVRDDARRTFNERADAQLRALVLAAIDTTQARLRDQNTLAPTMSVPLPPSLGDASSHCESELANGGWNVTIVAAADGRMMYCDCMFARSAEVWRLTKSELQGAGTIHSAHAVQPPATNP